MEDKRLILVVDDTKINLIIAEKLLHDQGFDTITAKNGSDAVEIVKGTRGSRRKLSLVLMDQCMPVMDGSDATRIIKEFDSDLPIVGLTTEVDPTILENFKNAGLSEIYSKPVSKSSMQDITRKHSL